MKFKSNQYAPILFAVILMMIGLSSVLERVMERLAADRFLSIAMIQLLVYLIPLAFYCRVRGLHPFSQVSLRPVSLRKIPLIVILMFILFVGVLIFRYLGLFLFDFAFLETPPTVYLPLTDGNRFLIFLCNVLLPAVLEETLFRGLLLKEYRSYGIFWSIGMTSIMFAMAHLSAVHFVYYLFMGVIFSVIAYAADSLLPGIILHILVNLSHTYLRPGVIEYLRQAGKSLLLPYLLIALFLLLFVLLFARLEIIYRERSYDEMLQSRKELLRKEAEESHSDKEKGSEKDKKSFFDRFRELYLSPAFLAAVVVFLILITGIIP